MRPIPALVSILILAAACGGPNQPPTDVGNHGGATDDDAVAALRALEGALKNDDGTAFAALLPPEGAWLWVQPGVALQPVLILTPGSARKPSAWFADDEDLDPYGDVRKSLVDSFAGVIDVIDRNPADRHAAIYGSCDADAEGNLVAAQRSWLAAESIDPIYAEIIADTPFKLTPANSEGLIHFHSWDLDVWMRRDQGTVHVVHLWWSTPCEA